jgi:hypothetical protein
VTWQAVGGSRREALLAGLALAASTLSPTAAWADDDSDTAEAEAQMRSVLAKQPAIGGFSTLTATLAGGGLLLSFDVPAAWTPGPQSSGVDGDGFQFTTWGGLVDPVLGPIAVEATLRTRAVPESVVRVHAT